MLLNFVKLCYGFLLYILWVFLELGCFAFLVTIYFAIYHIFYFYALMLCLLYDVSFYTGVPGRFIH